MLFILHYLPLRGYYDGTVQIIKTMVRQVKKIEGLAVFHLLLLNVVNCWQNVIQINEVIVLTLRIFVAHFTASHRTSSKVKRD